MSERASKRQEREKNQKDCTHDWQILSADVEVASYSIVSLITGPTRARISCDVLVCKKCEKTIAPIDNEDV